MDANNHHRQERPDTALDKETPKHRVRKVAIAEFLNSLIGRDEFKVGGKVTGGREVIYDNNFDIV